MMYPIVVTRLSINLFWPYALWITWRTSSHSPDISIPTIHVNHPVLIGYSPTRDNA
jgi:hypothetical protein